jgi:hypothetical protein
MSRQTLPGFTAESSRSERWNPYIGLSDGLSRSLGSERIEPAIKLRNLSPVVVKFLQEYFACWNTCYSNCVKQNPNSPEGCKWVAQSCCLYDTHCSYCEP